LFKYADSKDEDVITPLDKIVADIETVLSGKVKVSISCKRDPLDLPGIGISAKTSVIPTSLIPIFSSIALSIKLAPETAE